MLAPESEEDEDDDEVEVVVDDSFLASFFVSFVSLDFVSLDEEESDSALTDLLEDPRLSVL